METLGKMVLQNQANSIKKDLFGDDKGQTEEEKKSKNKALAKEQAARVSRALFSCAFRLRLQSQRGPAHQLIPRRKSCCGMPAGIAARCCMALYACTL